MVLHAVENRPALSPELSFKAFYLAFSESLDALPKEMVHDLQLEPGFDPENHHLQALTCHTSDWVMGLVTNRNKKGKIGKSKKKLLCEG